MNLELYPAIKQAALHIAYDNGLINRSMPEHSFLAKVETVLDDLEQPATLNSALEELSAGDLDVLCTGEEQEGQRAIAGHPMSEDINDLLMKIFEC